MSDLSLLSILNGNNYLCANRSLAHTIGLHEAIILTEIIDKYEFFKLNDELKQIGDTDGWFFLTMEKIFERTSLTERQQRPAINNLIKLGFITTRTYGQPSKRYFNINQNALLALFALDQKRDKHLSSKKVCRDDKMSPLEITKCHPYGLQNVIPINKEQNPRIKNPELRKDNVSLKSRPSKTMEAAKKFKLTLEQEGAFNWLKQQVKNTSEDTLCYWSKTYDFDKIVSCYHEAKAHNPSNLGGYINKLLKVATNLPSAAQEQCREFAEDFIRENDWLDAKINKNYLTYFEGKTRLEISLAQDPIVFARQVIQIFTNLKTKR